MNHTLEVTRIIQRIEPTKEEFEAQTVLLLSEITRIEEPYDDDFENKGPKTVIWLRDGTTPWVLMRYADVRRIWLDYLRESQAQNFAFTRN